MVAGVVGPLSAAAASGASPAASFTSLELFTGAGGLALGTHLAGFHHVALVEWNADAHRTLATNAAAGAVAGIQAWHVLREDARGLSFREFGPVDLVAGGPPCQPFSIGGKHRGMADARDMIPRFIRAIRELTPKAFILENVRGLLRPAFRAYLDSVLLALRYPLIGGAAEHSWLADLASFEDPRRLSRYAGPRYTVRLRLLNAADYGVPQTRQRVFMVGIRDDLGVDWDFPPPTHGREALRHAREVSGAYWARHGLRPPPPPRAGEREVAAPPALQPWRTVRDALADLPDPRDETRAAAFPDHRFQPGARAYPGHTGSVLDLPAKTLKAGVHGVPGGENMLIDDDGQVRYFTVREAARLQTFPDNWRFEGAWSEAMRQLGNAVPVELARVVAASVARALAAAPGSPPAPLVASPAAGRPADTR